MGDNGNILAQLSNALSATVEAVSRSIVRVEARRRGHASGIAWSKEGLVVTAHHAVQRDHDLRIGLPEGGTVEAELIGRDPTTDVAVLRARGATLHPPAWAEADSLHVGHLVLSVGRHDTHAQASLGIVAKKDGAWRTPTGGHVDAFLQTDILVYPGFSGSALVDAEGRAGGMNTSWFLRRSSLTLPAATLRRVVGVLLEHGRVRRGLLGVGAHPAQLPGSVRQDLEQHAGLLVVSVEDESPAEAAGVLVGDLIVGLDGEPVQHLESLLFLLTEERIGKAVPLRVVRGGRLETLTVTVGERR